VSIKEKAEIKKRMDTIRAAIKLIGVPKDSKDKRDLAQHNAALETLGDKLSKMILERRV